jgi:arylformamidase
MLNGRYAPRMMVDLTHAISSDTPVFPGDAPVSIEVIEASQEHTGQDQTAGRRSLNVGRVAITLHTGTHMDAPFHFFDSGRTIDCVPLDHCIGPAALVDVRGVEAGGPVDLENVPGLRERLRSIPKVVLRTDWWKRWGQDGYFTDHPVLTADAAQFLVDSGVHLVGVDMPSVDLPPFAAHLVLLGNGVLIVENLTNLDAVPAEGFHLTALPLKVMGRDGSPVRAVATF